VVTERGEGVVRRGEGGGEERKLLVRRDADGFLSN
jgi:hypothetical protein